MKMAINTNKLREEKKDDIYLVDVLITIFSSIPLTFVVSFPYFIIFGTEFIRKFGIFTTISSLPIISFVMFKFINFNYKELASKLKEIKSKMNNFHNFIPFMISGGIAAILLFRTNTLLKKANEFNNPYDFGQYAGDTKNFYAYGFSLLILSLLGTFILQTIKVSKITKQPCIKVVKSIIIPYVKFIGLLCLMEIALLSVYFMIFIITNLIGGAPFGG